MPESFDCSLHIEVIFRAAHGMRADGVDLNGVRQMIKRARAHLEAYQNSVEDPNFELISEPRGIHVEFPTRYEGLHTRVFEDNDIEYIEASWRGRSGSVVRSDNVFGLHAQTGSRDTGEDFEEPVLIIPLFPDMPQDERHAHRYTDRGVCWVYPKSGRAMLTLQNWDDSDVDIDELVDIVRGAYDRVHEVLGTFVT